MRSNIRGPHHLYDRPTPHILTRTTGEEWRRLILLAPALACHRLLPTRLLLPHELPPSSGPPRLLSKVRAYLSVCLCAPESIANYCTCPCRPPLVSLSYLSGAWSIFLMTTLLYRTVSEGLTCSTPCAASLLSHIHDCTFTCRFHTA